MSTISKIVGTFSGLEAEKKAEQIKAVEYIQHIAASSSVNLDRWNISKLFDDGEEGPTIITDKSEINKIFFVEAEKRKEKNEKKKDKPETEASFSSDKIKEQISALVNSQVNNYRRNLETQIQNATQHITELTRQINNDIKIIGERRLALGSLDGESIESKIKEGFDKIVAEGNWVNPVIEGDYIYFNTGADIIMKYAPTESSVNFGKLAAKINLTNLSSTVIPYKKNRVSGTYYHPHVGFHGSICWGHAADQVASYQNELKVYEIMSLLYALLHTYCDEAPYTSIQSFEKAGAYRSDGRSDMEHPDKRAAREKRLAKEREKFIENYSENADSDDGSGVCLFVEA
jgi:hypothetical protein